MLRRLTSTPVTPVETPPRAPVPPAPPAGTGSGATALGKGRPTPKRREAEQARKQRVQAPKSRREAGRAARERAKQDRARTRQALATGDERYLPARDRGPVRAFVRDFIDARRSVAEFFLFVALGVLLLSLLPSPALRTASGLIWLLALPLIAVDSVLLSRRLRKALRTRFPDEVAAGRDTRGAVAYALMRSLQIRRLRLPPPRVKPGARV